MLVDYANEPFKENYNRLLEQVHEDTASYLLSLPENEWVQDPRAASLANDIMGHRRGMAVSKADFITHAKEAFYSDNKEIQDFASDFLKPYTSMLRVANTIVEGTFSIDVAKAIKDNRIQLVEGDHNVHAEIKLKYASPGSRSYIGITKLSCCPCALVLGIEQQPKLYGGTHGKVYATWEVHEQMLKDGSADKLLTDLRTNVRPGVYGLKRDSYNVTELELKVGKLLTSEHDTPQEFQEAVQQKIKQIEQSLKELEEKLGRLSEERIANNRALAEYAKKREEVVAASIERYKKDNPRINPTKNALKDAKLRGEEAFDKAPQNKARKKQLDDENSQLLKKIEISEKTKKNIQESKRRYQILINNWGLRTWGNH